MIINNIFRKTQNQCFFYCYIRFILHLCIPTSPMYTTINLTTFQSGGKFDFLINTCGDVFAPTDCILTKKLSPHGKYI
jgi:hypothetical protein